jgi:hypothetical protein
MRARAVLVAVGWLIAAGGTATTATVALNTLGEGILGPSTRPLSQAEIQRDLGRGQPAASPSATASASDPGTPSAPVTPEPGTSVTAGPTTAAPAAPTPATNPPRRGVFATAGGTVFAQCAGGLATLTSWSPAQGYWTDDFARGPASAAFISFKTNTSEVRVTVTCVAGEPTSTVTAEDRHGGGHG